MLASEALGLELSVKFHVTPVSQDEVEGLEDPPVILSEAEPLLGQTLLAIYNQSKMLPVYNYLDSDTLWTGRALSWARTCVHASGSGSWTLSTQLDRLPPDTAKAAVVLRAWGPSGVGDAYQLAFERPQILFRMA
ncbi:hypothetical protein QBZ16_002989 [Prototheca wickerhamii]|uniref:Uncharacterized protein n=1 Tax=Prototheca wickerhamii TaxID=3111 RepID=A0AAD9IJ79_PROWI|nr:hypothetical protein QBZ16_002989 [Prototheca wickerhamii]